MENKINKEHLIRMLKDWTEMLEKDFWANLPKVTDGMNFHLEMYKRTFTNYLQQSVIELMRKDEQNQKGEQNGKQ